MAERGAQPALLLVLPRAGVDRATHGPKSHNGAASRPDQQVILSMARVFSKTAQCGKCLPGQGQSLIAEGHAEKAGAKLCPEGVEPHEARTIGQEVEVDVSERGGIGGQPLP